MADNVNIIVQDTINDIVVNAAQIVETIDINVQAAVDVVDIVANPNNYVVNINRIIGEQVQSDWNQSDNQAPDYIKNKPTIPTAQVNSDWNATSGVEQILNKPNLATVATSGSYNDLSNKPSIPTATSDLTNDGADGVNPFITAADVPAQVNSDWNATSGVAEILNKPTIPPAVTIDAVPTDGSANAVSSNGTFDALATKYNNPTGTTAQYIDGTGAFQTFPTTLPAENLQTYGRNSTGATLYRGTIVYISGSTGFRPNFTKAQANAETTSARTFGVILNDIANNADGYVVNIGAIDNLDTRSTATHPFTTDTLADGDTVYLSPTNAGYITNVKPYAPYHLVYIGKVIRTSPINGTIVYQIQNGYELDELHNVSAQTPSNNDGLFYESSTSLWKNKPIATVLGYTPTTNARTISTTAPLSGGGDLSADRTLSISQATTSTNGYLSSTDWNTFNGKFTLPSLTSGSVLFSNGTTIAQDNTNLFWDNTNKRLGIGTSTPENQFQVKGGTVTSYAQITSGVGIQSNSSGSGLITAINVTPSDPTSGISNGANFGFNGSSNNFYGIGLGAIRTSKYDMWFQTGLGNGGGYRWYIGITEKMTLFQNGNVAINTTTDAGYKLDVNGTARFVNAIIAPSISAASTGRIDITGGFNVSTNSSCRITGTISGEPILMIGSGTGSASAQVQIDSTTKGFLPPRMTTTQKNAIATPAAGLVVYDTTTNKHCGYNGTTWNDFY